MKINETENRIMNYCDNIFDIYPKYNKYLNLNNNISDYILAIYYSNKIPKNLEYSNYFTNEQSILLAREIIGSILPDLVTKYDKYIYENRIKFEDIDYSLTTNKDGEIESVIRISNTLEQPINILHEFMHCIHLEKFNELSYEEYYYYTEIMGMIGDIYSVFYLIKNNISKEDSYVYLCDIMNKMAQNADSVLSFGKIMDVYRTKKGLSKHNISNYIKENNISPKFINIIKKYNDVKDFRYHEEARYIFAFPIAFMISLDLISGNIEKYKLAFNSLPYVKTDVLLHDLILDSHFNDEEQLDILMNNIYSDIVGLFEDDKVKKLGVK